MPPHRWLVSGVDCYGEPFECSHDTEEAAAMTVERMNRRGGNVTFRRLDWNGPAAAYRDPAEPYARHYGDADL